MSDLLLLVENYLDRASNGDPPGMSEEIIAEASKAFGDALRNKFQIGNKNDGFTMRLSNLGRPLCQLQLEQQGAPREEKPYNFAMQMVFGDAIEAIAVAVMKAAGVKIETAQAEVKLLLDGIKITGHYDVKLEGEGIRDIKSASNASFLSKFSGGYAWKNMVEHDTFGYLVQGYSYAQATNTRFDGWIAINKENGKWAVLDTPEDDYEVRIKSLKTAEKNVKALQDGAPFKRCFTDEPELFRNKETGNRVLGTTCSYCDFKRTCWPGVQFLPQRASTAGNKPYKYYTYLKEEDDGEL